MGLFCNDTFFQVLPPIYQCHAGHLVCTSCRPKLNCCPTCRGALGMFCKQKHLKCSSNHSFILFLIMSGNIRNLAMEKVASTVVFPCKYSANGCPALLLHTEKIDHEDACENRPYFCPCPGKSYVAIVAFLNNEIIT